MSKELDLSVPEADKKNGKISFKWAYVLLTVLILLSLLNTAILLKGKPAINIAGHYASTLSPEELKQLAMKLEKQALNLQAVDAWKNYLSVSGQDADETAKIWYRIGKIYQAQGDYDNALDAFYRSESFSKPEDIRDEMNRRIQECLESAGKFAALRYELGERVGENPNTKGSQSNNGVEAGDKIVAEIGSYRITREDLDKKIEKLIESRINGLSRYVSKDRINKEKENLLKQYSSENGRRMFLEQYIIEELLYRKAREERLAETPEVKDALRNMERSLLASRVLENAYADEIKLTPVDVKNYYEANKAEYVKKDEDGKEHQLGFDEVKDRVTLDLMSEKEKDVQKDLISRLREKYNVVVHNSALSPDETQDKK